MQHSSKSLILNFLIVCFLVIGDIESFPYLGTVEIREYNPHLQGYDDDVLLGGLQEVIDSYAKSDFNSDFFNKYSNHIDRSTMKAKGVEMGYAFEKAALGASISKENLERMTRKFIYK